MRVLDEERGSICHSGKQLSCKKSISIQKRLTFAPLFVNYLNQQQFYDAKNRYVFAID